ncbi:hypothetical protein [Nitrosomonas halophila]|uniref:Uncharacterized protein n=1 Tax=Nitrosomonas halophila TaxID=44576 RepID=A0A1H3GFS7_9PROT|nr:hypothetical protein [Nitrosomonas halophila]SDY02146.1 hypothetical protein SAMN05421881_101520 [Nitrosomonas halophila]
MKYLSCLFVTLGMLSVIPQGNAMSLYDDPRMIYSYKDKALAPEIDILQVSTLISPNDELVIQVKTRGERATGEIGDYYLVKIHQISTHAFVIPVSRTEASGIQLYAGLEQSDDLEPYRLLKRFIEADTNHPFRMAYIDNGFEVYIPLSWINFAATFSYDVYTVRAGREGQHLTLENVYDQARKGREEPKIPALTLVNRLCSPKR